MAGIAGGGPAIGSTGLRQGGGETPATECFSNVPGNVLHPDLSILNSQFSIRSPRSLPRPMEFRGCFLYSHGFGRLVPANPRSERPLEQVENRAGSLSDDPLQGA